MKIISSVEHRDSISVGKPFPFFSRAPSSQLRLPLNKPTLAPETVEIESKGNALALGQVGAIQLIDSDRWIDTWTIVAGWVVFTVTLDIDR